MPLYLCMCINIYIYLCVCVRVIYLTQTVLWHGRRPIPWSMNSVDSLCTNITNLLYTRQEYKSIVTEQNFLMKLRVSHFVISVTLHCMKVQETVDITVCACSPRMASSHCSLSVFIQVFVGKLSLRCSASRWKLLIMGSSRDLLVVIWAQYLVPGGNY